MKLATVLATGLSLATLPALADDKLPSLKEGQWDTTIKIDMPGLPIAMPPFTTSSCITKKDLVPKTQQPGQDCKVKSQKIVGDTVEWAVQCKDEGGMVMDGSGKVTYKGESFGGNMTMSMSGGGHPGMQMSYVMTGKRTGDCKKAAAAAP